MKSKRLGALALALVLALSALSGCGVKSPDDSSASGTGDSSDDSSQIVPMDLSQVSDPCLAVSGLAADEAVITVGDTEVTAADYLYWLNRVLSSYLSQLGGTRISIPWDSEAEAGLTFGQYVIEQAADTALLYAVLRQLAQTEGLSPAPSVAADTDDDYAGIVLQLGGDETRATHFLWSNMLTKEQLIKLNENDDLYDQLQELYYGEDSDHYPTDAEVNAYLDEAGRYRCKHILLMTIDPDTRQPLDEETVARQRATADDLLAQLRAAEDHVALFDQLMHEYSEDSGLVTNPDGYDAYRGQMVAPFEEAALGLNVGEISGIVESEFGYHIILRLPIDPAKYRDECVSYLMEERIDAERDRLGVTRTDAFNKLDIDSFWNNMLSLQSAFQAELAG